LQTTFCPLTIASKLSAFLELNDGIHFFMVYIFIVTKALFSFTHALPVTHLLAFFHIFLTKKKARL